jgi:hypothetical protein
MSRPVEFLRDTTPVPEPIPAALLESLERSKAQAEAGLSVPLEPALDRLRASIARMQAKNNA